MQIILANKEDLDEILSLQKLCYTSEAEIYNDYSIKPLKQDLDGILRDFTEQRILKAVSEGNKIIGSIRTLQKSDTVFVNRVIVHPQFQNQGIGGQLLKTAEGFYTTNKRFELFTGYRSEKNIYFYQKHGYRIFRDEKVNDHFSFVYMEKRRD